MSRYTSTITKENKQYEVAFGYDVPLSEYFLQVFDLSKVTEDDEGLILDEGSWMTGKSNSEMLELYIEWQVPDKYRECVVLDLPF